MVKRTSLTRGEKVLLIAVILFVVLISAGFIWRNSLNATPVVSIPTPVMPSPNAFDYYTKAGRLVKTISMGSYTLDVGTATVHTKPGTVLATGPRTKVSKGRPTPTLADMQALTAANAPVIAALHQGFRHRFREPSVHSLDQPTPALSGYRNVARVLSVAAYTAGRCDNWPLAIEYSIDGIQFGNEVQNDGILINMLVGIAIQSIDRLQAWEAVDHINAGQARAAARRFERIYAGEYSYADALQGEKWALQAGLLELFRRPGWRKESMQYWGYRSGPAFAVAKGFFISKCEVMRNTTSYMDAVIADAKLPYATRRKVPPLPGDPISQGIVPSFLDKALLYKTGTKTQNNLLMFTLALRAYKLEHGQYPPTLSALVPGYLNALPADPFAIKGTFRYQRRGKAYVLYSIGPDGKDDGGTPSKDGQRKGVVAGVSPTIQPGSTGDIVAGVNLQ